MTVEKQLPRIIDFRPFVICTPDNYESTKAFYSDIGFTKLWGNGNSACEYATGIEVIQA